MSTKILSFTGLVAWQKAHQLILETYKQTVNFPQNEQFGLTSQIRRSAVSVTSNVAEGFSRKSSADKLHFYTIALGSLTEFQSQLLLARDLSLLSDQIFDSIAAQSVEVSKLLNGLKGFVKKP